MFCMSAMTSAMPTVGVRRTVSAPRAAQPQALSAFPAMNGMSSASLGLRSEGACRVGDEPDRPRRPNRARRDDTPRAATTRNSRRRHRRFSTLGAGRIARRVPFTGARCPLSGFWGFGLWIIDAGGRTGFLRTSASRDGVTPSADAPRRTLAEPHAPVPRTHFVPDPPNPTLTHHCPPPYLIIRCLRGVFRRGEWG